MAVFTWDTPVGWDEDVWDSPPVPIHLEKDYIEGVRVFARFEVDFQDDSIYNFLPNVDAGKRTLEWMNLRGDMIQNPGTDTPARVEEWVLDEDRVMDDYTSGLESDDWVDISDQIQSWSTDYGNKDIFKLASGSITLRESASSWIPDITGSYDLDGRMYIAFCFIEGDKLHVFDTKVGEISSRRNIKLYGFYEHLRTALCRPGERLEYTWEEIARLAMGARLLIDYNTDQVVPFNPDTDDPDEFVFDPGIPFIKEVEGGRPPYYLGIPTGYEYLQPNINSTIFKGLQSISRLETGFACEGPNAQIMAQTVWELGSNSEEFDSAVAAGETGYAVNSMEAEFRNRYTRYLYIPPDAVVAGRDEYVYEDVEGINKWGVKEISLPAWLGNDPDDGLERYDAYTRPGYFRMWEITTQAASTEMINTFMRYPIVVHGDFFWGDNQHLSMTPISMKLSSHDNLVRMTMVCAENVPGEIIRVDEWELDEDELG